MKNTDNRERCREYLPNGRGCRGYVPQVKTPCEAMVGSIQPAAEAHREAGPLTTKRQMEAFTCSLMHLCRYCYRMRFGPHRRGKIKNELNSAQIRRRHLRFHKEPARRLYRPSFFREWLAYWKTWWRGHTD
ncbi:MAG: hypothetical protein AB1599_09960 [Planctomycetota bacterium]